MAAFPAIRQTVLSWFKQSGSGDTEVSSTEAVIMRRECLVSLIASGTCTGEFGALALMGMSPKDF